MQCVDTAQCTVADFVAAIGAKESVMLGHSFT